MNTSPTGQADHDVRERSHLRGGDLERTPFLKPGDSPVAVPFNLTESLNGPPVDIQAMLPEILARLFQEKKNACIKKAFERLKEKHGIEILP